MSESTFNTRQLHAWIGRLREGDQTARDELIDAVYQRLERLARRMLRGYGQLRQAHDTVDVLHNALLRLVPTLDRDEVRATTTREFVAFAASCIRSELLDLARRCASQKRGGGIRRVALDADSAFGGLAGLVASAGDQDDLDDWCRFHEAVEHLPADQREVFGLRFYHGWTHAQVAELLQVTPRTARRHWFAACSALAKAVGKPVPAE